MNNKRSELANILRQLADYIDSQSDERLASLFNQATLLMQTESKGKKNLSRSKIPIDAEYLHKIIGQLNEMPTRESGEILLKEKISNKASLESLARLLHLPVQRDDTVERLRAKIIENIIGSRLRSDAIQGGNQSRNFQKG